MSRVQSDRDRFIAVRYGRSPSMSIMNLYESLGCTGACLLVIGYWIIIKASVAGATSTGLSDGPHGTLGVWYRLEGTVP